MPPGLGKTIGGPDSDDYVAQVLAKEALDSSKKYSALGMEAYMPTRPTGSAPKPNTRFLRHIIKETDNHNTALKRKEEREARERIRQLRDKAPSSAQDSSRDYRHRRSHRSDDRESRREKEDREDRHRSHRRRRRSRSASLNRDRQRASRRKRELRDRDDDRHRRSRKSRRYGSYSRSRSRSPHGMDAESRSRRHRHRRRSSSRSRSPVLKESPPVKGSSRREISSKSAPDSQDVDESDPLEDLVGPLPKEAAPIRSRGRGAYKPNTSTIDSHFAPDYDPSLDVQPADDEAQTSNRPTRRPVAGLMTGEDDWELALEALRDRTRWKQKGEDRLREAGFNSDIVERWKNSASTANDEEMVDNVKWSTKSEGREWDRGKFVDGDGHINVKASW
ncbi:hypothetical protein BDW62DRAFT_194768 [Aspergillus aurantiobrunneus]